MPDDFLETVKEMFELKEGEEHDFAWKTCNEKVKAPWHDLHTLEHAKEAFANCRPMLQSTQQTKKVYLDVINRKAAVKTEKKKEKDKPKEFSYNQEFQTTKQKLFCQKHSKPGLDLSNPGTVFCYVKTAGPYVGHYKCITPRVLGLWARLVHDGKADCDFIQPPNDSNFNYLNDSAQSSVNPPTHGHHQQSSTNVHVHLDEGFVQELQGDSPQKSKPVLKRKCSSSLDKEDKVVIIGEGGKENPHHQTSRFENMHTDEILSIVDAKYLELAYCQYRQKLVAEGIVYGTSIYNFDRSFFELHYDERANRQRHEPLGNISTKTN
uniref:Uncharacterized protein n=1 Tax=Moniliophthora roreri TaxID=221103 RepID=A0A0W0FWY8_MONRR